SVASSITAVAFYQSLGFQVIRKTKFLMHGAWIPCIEMEKPLTLLPTQPQDISPLLLWCCAFVFVALLLMLL
ncbi:MAG: hypothetical protein AAF329_13620, partial [Cyanobacteria bacterium P01_A01_bin.17]